MERFFTALQFLTVFRVKKDIEVTGESLASSMAYFPLVGALQGLILAAVYSLLSDTGLLQESVSVAIALLVLVITNGALHLDGFADTVDGLAGGRTPEERLRIMRDSSVGAVGVVFLVFLLLIKYLAIQEVPDEYRARIFFIFPVIGRWAPVLMAYLAPYARTDSGLGASFASNSRATLIKATVIACILSAFALGALSLVLVGLVGVSVYLFTRFFKRRLGGVTGDVFGFQAEAAELLFVIMALAMMNIFAIYSELYA